jgi:hypothetical protein
MEAAVANSDAKAAQKLLRMPGKANGNVDIGIDRQPLPSPLVVSTCFKMRPDSASLPLYLLGTNAGRGLYHRVLEACARAEDWQAVSLLVKEMEEDKDLPLDADSYLALMDGSTHAKNLSRLQRYANKMRDAVRTNKTHIMKNE